jgi:hypothetical protein
MSPRDVVDIMRSFRAIRWRWDPAGWSEIAAELCVTEVERAGREGAWRVTCSPLHGHELTVFIYQGQVDSVEVTVDVFLDTDELSGPEYDDKADEFYDKYCSALQAAESAFGEPGFNGNMDDEGYPEDQDAEWLALWPAENGRLMIQQKHEDRELPFRICVVVAPPG